jgi:competence protein ComGC
MSGATVHCRILSMGKLSRKISGKAFMFLELLCVLAIIAILTGLLLGAVEKSHSKAKKLDRDLRDGQTNIMKMEEPGGLLSSD